MTTQRKNILVGLTVLGAFVVLGWMIIQFGGRLGNLTAGDGYAVQLMAPRVDGLSEGSKVQYLGSAVGRVEAIALNSARTGFDVDLRIDAHANLPANVVAVIRAINYISGAAAVELQLAGVAAEGSLREVAGQKVIEAEYTGAQIVPDEFGTLATELRQAIEEFRSSGMIENVNRQVEQVGELAASLNELVGDDQLRGDVKQSVSSIREAAASAERVGKQMEEFSTRLRAMQEDAAAVVTEAREISASVKQTAQHADEAIVSTRQQVESAGRNADEVSRRLLDRLEQMNGILAEVQAVTASINEGKGTAGKLLKDDRAYELLVDNLRVLQETLNTANRLLQQWEEEGIDLNLF